MQTSRSGPSVSTPRPGCPRRLPANALTAGSKRTATFERHRLKDTPATSPRQARNCSAIRGPPPASLEAGPALRSESPVPLSSDSPSDSLAPSCHLALCFGVDLSKPGTPEDAFPSPLFLCDGPAPSSPQGALLMRASRTNQLYIQGALGGDSVPLVQKTKT